MPVLQVNSVEPKFGVNYDVGYIGFKYVDRNFLSNGIAYFTRWERLNQIRVSHCFVVSSKNECVHATMKMGVCIGQLDDWFNDPKCQVFFRKPRGYSVALGNRIVQTAASQLGRDYDFSLLFSQGIEGSYIGRMLHRIYGDDLSAALAKLCNSEDEWVCSELQAYSLDEQPEYHDVGCLSKPNAAISPQELFEDELLFEAWHNGR